MQNETPDTHPPNYAAARAALLQHTALSLLQHSRLVRHLDTQLLNVQRRFIKHQAGEATYPLAQLCADVQQIVDLVWLLVAPGAFSGGQGEYLISIAGSLEEWVAHYPQLDAAVPLVELLDARLSVLLDGVAGGKLTQTERVRLEPLANRLRVLVLSRCTHASSELMAGVILRCGGIHS